MKVLLDFSIFTQEPSAFGRVGGALELPMVPVVGDVISFLFPFKDGLRRVEGFSGHIAVAGRIVIPTKEGSDAVLSLCDVTMATTVDAEALSEYLELGFGLFVDRYAE